MVDVTPIGAKTAGRAPRPRVHPEVLRRSARKPVLETRHPFIAPSFPKSLEEAVREHGLPLIAEDSGLVDAMGWAGGDAIAAAYAEGVVFLGYPYLASLSQRAEYRVVTEIISSEMTREWIELKVASGDKGKTERVKELTDFLDNLDLRSAVKTCIEHDGFLGRGHLYLDTGRGDVPEELAMDLGNGRNVMSKQKVGLTEGQQKLRGVRAVEATWAYPTRYDSTDPLSPDWYNPRTWFVNTREVHRSRLLTLIGRPVLDVLKPAYAFGGLSMSQMLKPYVDNFLRTRQSVSDLISNFSKDVLKTNMDASTTIGGDQLMQRVALYNNIKNNQGTMLIDKDSEDFTNVSASLGGLDSLQAQSREHMAAIARTPIVKLFGIQPAGLNASSEGELVTWEDWVAAYQNFLLRPPLRTIIDFAQLTLWGKVDDDIGFDFKSLRQMKPQDRMQLEMVKAQVRGEYVTIGAVDAMEVREVVANDKDAPFSGIDLSEPLPAPGLPDEFGGEPYPGEENDNLAPNDDLRYANDSAVDKEGLSHGR